MGYDGYQYPGEGEQLHGEVTLTLNGCDGVSGDYHWEITCDPSIAQLINPYTNEPTDAVTTYDVNQVVLKSYGPSVKRGDIVVTCSVDDVGSGYTGGGSAPPPGKFAGGANAPASAKILSKPAPAHDPVLDANPPHNGIGYQSSYTSEVEDKTGK